MVGEGGLEPPRPEGHWHLKPARLPFRHSPETTGGAYHAGNPTSQPYWRTPGISKTSADASVTCTDAILRDLFVPGGYRGPIACMQALLPADTLVADNARVKTLHIERGRRSGSWD